MTRAEFQQQADAINSALLADTTKLNDASSRFHKIIEIYGKRVSAHRAELAALISDYHNSTEIV